VAGGPLLDNAHRYAVFWATTSLGWDVPRGVLTAAVIVLAGRPLINALRRTARQATFGSTSG
jgi:energy-coupling factor transport system substrate-specific component